MTGAINKTMDREDLGLPECAKVVDELNALMLLMKERGATYSSWYGTLDLPYHAWSEKMNRGRYQPWERNVDDRNIPWFLLWEIAWVISNTALKKGAAVLDMGGASSLFSCYLASKGHRVYSIDLNGDLVDNGNKAAKVMGWDMKCMKMDMRKLEFPDEFFDNIFSICVYEHIPLSSRIEINRDIKRILKPGGTFSLTFDYLNPAKLARISSPEEVKRQFVVPSGLDIIGSDAFYDNQKRYLEYPAYLLSFNRNVSRLSRITAVLSGSLSLSHALDCKKASYTFGALFLKKR